MIGITERGDAAIHYDEVLKGIERTGVKGVILITKDPQRLYDNLGTNAPPVPFIVHATITGFGGTMIEPNVPKPEHSLEAYRKLFIAYGDRVVLRVDPIFPSPRGFEVAETVIEECLGRLRVSFMDMYDHTKARLLAASGDRDEEMGLTIRRAYMGAFHAPLHVRQGFITDIEEQWQEDVEVCGEPGLKCTGCVSKRDIDALNLGHLGLHGSKGIQRQACQCLIEKTELLPHRKQCPHKCAYCYWK